jgi:SAM-dependent methyltransferase
MNSRKKLLRVYGRLRRAIVPTLEYSQTFYERRLREALQRDVDWLDLGCGHHVLPPWRHAAESTLVQEGRSATGIDRDLPSLHKHRTVRRRVCGDIGALPFRDGSFDLVTANMVVEHLSDPVAQFREIGRVLRPNGRLLLHTPNVLGYPTVFSRLVPELVKGSMIRLLDSRPAADVFPTYYRANTDRQLAITGGEAGLDLAVVQMVATDALFAVIPPIAAIELMALRLLLKPGLRRYRSNIIAVLKKQPGRAAQAISG